MEAVSVRWTVLPFVVAVILGVSFQVAEAREGWFLGAGLVHQSVSGDLDGKEAYLAGDGDVAILVGKVDPGTGFLVQGGYGFNDAVGIEIRMASSSHSASHDFDIDSDATVSWFNVGPRFSYGVSENLELLGRVGLGSYTVSFDKYALKGSLNGDAFVYTSQAAVDYTGTGYYLGVGAEYFINQVGLEFSYTYHSVELDEAEGGGVSGSLDDSLKATIGTLAFVVSYHF